MKRLSGILFMVALALPYARAPLCQVGGHDHGEGRMAHHEAQAVSDAHGGATCHALMGCQVGADLEPGMPRPAAYLGGAATAESALPREAPHDIWPAPESPPPRAI